MPHPHVTLLLSHPHFSYTCTSLASPEQTLPSREVGPLEECVFQYSLYSSKSLDHVRAIIVEVPQLSIMTLMSPPEWVLLENLRKEDGQLTINQDIHKILHNSCNMCLIELRVMNIPVITPNGQGIDRYSEHHGITHKLPPLT